MSYASKLEKANTISTYFKPPEPPKSWNYCLRACFQSECALIYDEFLEIRSLKHRGPGNIFKQRRINQILNSGGAVIRKLLRIEGWSRIFYRSDSLCVYINWGKVRKANVKSWKTDDGETNKGKPVSIESEGQRGASQNQPISNFKGPINKKIPVIRFIDHKCFKPFGAPTWMIKVPAEIQRFHFDLFKDFTSAMCIGNDVDRQVKMGQIHNNLYTKQLLPDFLVKVNIRYEGGNLVMDDPISIMPVVSSDGPEPTSRAVGGKELEDLFSRYKGHLCG